MSGKKDRALVPVSAGSACLIIPMIPLSTVKLKQKFWLEIVIEKLAPLIIIVTVLQEVVSRTTNS